MKRLLLLTSLLACGPVLGQGFGGFTDHAGDEASGDLLVIEDISPQATQKLSIGDLWTWYQTQAATPTAAWDFGGATSVELPQSATPTTDATGEIALDTTITDHQPLWQYEAATTQDMTIIAIDTAELPALDNEIIKYDAATDKFVLEADAGSGLSNVVEDTTPQLGGNLDVQTSEIVSTGTNDVDIHSNDEIILELGSADGTDKVSIRDSASAEVASINSDGDIAVTDLTANSMLYNEKAANGTPGAGKGEVWVKNTAPSTLIFTDDTDTDYVVPRVLTAYKTSDTERTNTTTATDDPDLTVELEASSYYTVQVYIRTRADNTTPGMKLEWTTPTLDADPGGYEVTLDAGSIENVWTATETPTANANDRLYMYTGVIHTSTAGTFAVKWAQNVLDAVNGTIMQKNSWMRLEKLN